MAAGDWSTAGGGAEFFFASGPSPFQAATMDGQVEAEANLLQKLESGGGSLAGALLLDKVQDFLAKLVGPVRSAFVRQQASQALSFESGLRLVKGGPRAAEQFGRRADGFSVDLNPTQHLVFDLKGVARIEEIVL